MGTKIPNKPVSAPNDEQRVLFIINFGTERPLVHGRQVKCPMCETDQDILEYQALHFVDKYAEHLVPIMKCRLCRHAFALRP